MSLADILPQSYGYVVIVSLLSFILNIYLSIKVGIGRKKYKVEYPDMYSKDSRIFNCIQRVHQNYLENLPFFLLLLFLGGLQYPRMAAGFGVGFLVSRLIYSQGYSTGIPENRKFGAFGSTFCLLGLLVQSSCFAYHLL